MTSTVSSDTSAAAACTLTVTGMHCASCVAHVEKALRGVPGVEDANVNLMTGSAVVRAGAATPQASLIEAIEAAGYHATIAEPGTPEQMPGMEHDETSGAVRRILVAAVLTAAVLIMDMGGHLGLFPIRTMNAPWWNWLQLAFTTPVVFGAGSGFFTGAWAALKSRTTNMNTLIALGTFAAWAWSAAVTVAPHYVAAHGGSGGAYFETAAVIITLILTGQLMEARSRGRARHTMQALLDLRPREAILVTDGGDVTIAGTAITVGARLRVKPGSQVPTDGKVTAGESWVDESMLTGESEPAHKVEGSLVTGGTLNRDGTFEMTATAVGSQTALARIAQLVQEAQASRAPIQRMADRVTAIFVPAVLAAAVLTFAGWFLFGPDPRLGHAVTAAVAVLIIACPCALGIATPTSIMVGSATAARMGVLFKSAPALERLSAVRCVVMDKTGTLTEGRPVVQNIKVADGWTEVDALAAAAAVEQGSEHPVARAIVDAANSRAVRAPDVSQFLAVPGRGARAIVAGRRVIAGSPALIKEARAVIPQELQTEIEELETRANTPVLLAVNGSVVAAIGIADAVKPSAAGAVARLKRLGLEVVMITGDRAAVANAAATEVGIRQVVAETLPANKASEINRLKKEFGVVAMVGDGVNDAPALASADVGIAIAAGTDIAIEAADVILTGSDLNGVVDAILLSRATMRNIRQNLTFAFGYNTLGIPMAAGLFYLLSGVVFSPIVSSVAMALSDISVVGNALRLARYKRQTA
ncbi:MAG: copper-translocating P-type ATPase [Armatimonadetes bacterium]|nr:copper-translocating P-type ATPase [Armatimonadota bacterium]MDE2207166.1 copper-translocating P-type ATPase [Armatimonadota bacterium]